MTEIKPQKPENKIIYSTVLILTEIKFRKCDSK